MPKTANIAPVKEAANTEITETAARKYTIDEVRKRAKIDILLPSYGAEEGDLYEFVTVNGVTTQIKRGVVVPVNWLIFEALTNPMTGKYPRSIMAN